jgi:hypothetical protein
MNRPKNDIRKTLTIRVNAGQNDILTYTLGIVVCHEDVGFVRGKEAIAVDVLQVGDTTRRERGEKGVRKTESTKVSSGDRIENRPIVFTHS